jgi:hypothetical protein
LNFNDIPPIKAFAKPRIRSPQDRPVHLPSVRSSSRDCFQSTNRFGSWLNSLACSDLEDSKIIHEECILMNQERAATVKHHRLIYKRKMLTTQERNSMKGASFRGRGLMYLIFITVERLN